MFFYIFFFDDVILLSCDLLRVSEILVFIHNWFPVTSVQISSLCQDVKLKSPGILPLTSAANTKTVHHHIQQQEVMSPRVYVP